VMVDNGLVLVVDSAITDELQLEWDVRDLVRAIQDARKEAWYNVADRILLSVVSQDDASQPLIDIMLSTRKHYLEQETLSTVGWVDTSDISKEIELSGYTVTFALKK
jgi:isoleucyl-tRNA synthetase